MVRGLCTFSVCTGQYTGSEHIISISTVRGGLVLSIEEGDLYQQFNIKEVLEANETGH